MSSRIQALDRGANSLLLITPHTRVLIDAFLGHSYHSYAPWFFYSQRPKPEVWPAPFFDTLIISNHEGDHCHPEVLKLLPKNVRVFAHQRAVPILRSLEFSDIRPLNNFLNYTLSPTLNMMILPSFADHHALYFQEGHTRYGIAPHGWLPKSWPAQATCQTMFIGTESALFKIPGIPSRLLPYSGTLTAMPSAYPKDFKILKTERVFFIHNTLETRSGFASRYLLKFPLGPKHRQEMKRFLLEHCPKLKEIRSLCLAQKQNL